MINVLLLFFTCNKSIYASDFYDINYDSIKSVSDASTLSEHGSSKSSVIMTGKEIEIIESIKKFIENEQISELYFFLKTQDYKKHNDLVFLEACLQEISNAHIEIYEKKNFITYLDEKPLDFKAFSLTVPTYEFMTTISEYESVKLNSLYVTRAHPFYEEKFFILKHISKTPDACKLLLDYYTPLNCRKIIEILEYLQERKQLTSDMSEKFVINVIQHHSLYDVEEYQYILKNHIHKENEHNIKAIIRMHKDKEYLNAILFA